MLVARRILKFKDRIIGVGETVPEGLLGPYSLRSHLNLGRVERVLAKPPPPHKCEICEKGFKSTRALKVHRSYHKGRGRKNGLEL